MATPPLPLLLDRDVLEQQPDQASLTTRYVDEAVRFIRADDKRPFFLYLAHMYVHLPIYVQQRFADASENGRYGAAVESIDWAAAVILHELQAQGIDDDTLVIFSSDNGSLAQDGGSNDPLRGTKRTTWEGGMRVPCIMRWPGRITAGQVVDDVTSAIDLYPTLASICGAELPNDRTIDGLDLTPRLLGDERSARDTFFYYNMNDLEAVRHGAFKLHFSKEGEEHHALYNLDDDISESVDIAAANPQVVAALEVLAEQARHSLGDARLQRPGSDRRPAGRVESPAKLTRYDPDHPYYAAEYDLPDRG